MVVTFEVFNCLSETVKPEGFGVCWEDEEGQYETYDSDYKYGMTFKANSSKIVTLKFKSYSSYSHNGVYKFGGNGNLGCNVNFSFIHNYYFDYEWA